MDIHGHKFLKRERLPKLVELTRKDTVLGATVLYHGLFPCSLSLFVTIHSPISA